MLLVYQVLIVQHSFFFTDYKWRERCTNAWRDCMAARSVAAGCSTLAKSWTGSTSRNPGDDSWQMLAGCWRRKLQHELLKTVCAGDEICVFDGQSWSWRSRWRWRRRLLRFTHTIWRQICRVTSCGKNATVMSFGGLRNFQKAFYLLTKSMFILGRDWEWWSLLSCFEGNIFNFNI